MTQQTVIPVLRKATLLKTITADGQTIAKGTALLAGTSFFPRRKRKWHTRVETMDGFSFVVRRDQLQIAA